MKKVRKAIVSVPTTAVMTPFVTETAVPERPSTPEAPPLLDRLAHPLDDVVLALEEAERPRPCVRSST